MKKLFSLFFAILVSVALMVIPAFEVKSGSCSTWYDTNYEVLEAFADGSVNMRVTYTTRCKGEETTHTFCFWSNEDGTETVIIDCP